MAYAIVDDVEDRWRPLSGSEKLTAAVLLGDAEGILLTQMPTLAARVTAGTLSRSVVAAVEARMVLRVMKNPDGLVAENIDDYAYRRADAVADGRLYLDADDRALLLPVEAAGGAYTITPAGSPGFAPVPLNWWELNL